MSYTEFYCRTTGSNVNAGSTNADAATYTGTNGGWNSGTGVWTPTSGDPSATVSIGDFASVYTDGAAVTGFVGRVTGVSSTTITIKVNTDGFSGTVPTTAGTGLSCKVGGAWQGPNAAVAFPFNFVTSVLFSATGATTPPRVNFKNGTSYAITAAMTHTKAGPVCFQGFTTTPGDGGRATIDGGTATNYVLLAISGANTHMLDLIFQNNGTGGGPDGVQLSGHECLLQRVSVLSVRGNALAISSASVAIECEGQSNANGAGIYVNPGNNLSATLVRCVAHDCVGASGNGFSMGTGLVTLIRCIADKNGNHGFYYNGANGATLINCDAFNNAGDGLNFAPSNAGLLYAEGCNFSLNAAYGVTIAGTASNSVLQTNGYGGGSYINTSGQVSGSPTVNTAPITYTTTPYTSAATSGTPRAGDFGIALAEAKGVGRGNFTQSATQYSSTTTGYPDVGAAQHLEAAASGGGFISG